MAFVRRIGAYIPRARLPRKAIAAATEWLSGASPDAVRGERAICNWDEDAVTMAVEAARECVGNRSWEELGGIVFCSATAPFAQRLNCAIVAEALAARDAECLDLTGSTRSATSAIISGSRQLGYTGPILIAAGERQRERYGCRKELLCGDGGGAVLLSKTDGIARLAHSFSRSIDFVDSYRSHESQYSHAWEERWVRDRGYFELLIETICQALTSWNLSSKDFRLCCIPAPTEAILRAVVQRLDLRGDATAVSLHMDCGDTGTSYPLLLLAKALELAAPGDRILLVGFGQGCDVLCLEATDGLIHERPESLTRAVKRKHIEQHYLRHLALSSQIEVDYGMRSEGDRGTSLSALYRNRRMLYGFIGGRCRHCGLAQFPKSRTCVNPACRHMDEMDDVRFADAPAKIATFARDWQAFSYSPPACYGLVDFSPSGRLLMEFADTDGSNLEVGTKMRAVFRALDRDPTRGFSKYFWKAVPADD